MHLDFEKMIEGVAHAMGVSLKNSAVEMENYSRHLLDKRKKRLEELFQLFAEGSIDEQQLKDELSDEARLLEAHLLAMQAISKAAAQKAANAAIDFINQYILDIVKHL